jgi:uncharacterized protein YjbI with pentapeptide repeats
VLTTIRKLSISLVVLLAILALPAWKIPTSLDLNVPNSISARGNQKLSQIFQESPTTQLTFIWRVKTNSSNKQPVTAAQISQEIAHLIHQRLPGRVVTQLLRGGTFAMIYQSDEDLVHSSLAVPGLRNALRGSWQGLDLSGIKVSGAAAMIADITPVLLHDLHLGELVGGFAALSWFTLRRRLKLFPPIALTAAGAIVVGQLLLHLLAQFQPVMSYAPNLTGLITLGLALDYSYLHRRQDLNRSHSANSSTVITSAATFTIATALGSLINIPFIRSLALSLALAPIAAYLSNYFMLKLWPASKLPVSIASEHLAKWFIQIRRRPWSALALCLTLAAISFSGLFGRELTASSTAMLPANLSSVQANLQAKSLGGAGITTPIQLILPANLITKNLISTIASDSEVQLVATDHRAPFIKDSFQRIFIFQRSNFDGPRAHAFDQRLIHKYLSGFRADAIFLSGASIQADDLIHALGQQYLVAGLIFYLLWLFLALRLRSIWLPLKSHLLALTSTLAGAGD